MLTPTVEVLAVLEALQYTYLPRPELRAKVNSYMSICGGPSNPPSGFFLTPSSFPSHTVVSHPSCVYLLNCRLQDWCPSVSAGTSKEFANWSEDRPQAAGASMVDQLLVSPCVSMFLWCLVFAPTCAYSSIDKVSPAAQRQAAAGPATDRASHITKYTAVPFGS
jgi:hypothetical protein